jgi:hypothetical protein
VSGQSRALSDEGEGRERADGSLFEVCASRVAGEALGLGAALGPSCGVHPCIPSQVKAQTYKHPLIY